MVADRSRHPLFARFYEAVSPGMERSGLTQLRQRLLSGLRGEVVEVGAGNGLNFGHYPPQVARVVAVEPEPYLRDHARRRASAAPVPVEVIAGVAERLPADDRSFDAAVVSLVMCSVGDPGAVAGELRRVLRPGGQVRFLEHVRADTSGVARVQRLLDATVWPLLTGGCHTHRDPVATFEQAGFRVERPSRLNFPDTRMIWPVSPHVLGTAVRADAGAVPT